MKRYALIIEPEAADDLGAIYRFIVQNDTAIQAERFLRKLQKVIDSLAYMPERFCQSIYIEDADVHDRVVHGYTICYAVREDRVHVVAVFRQRAL